MADPKGGLNTCLKCGAYCCSYVALHLPTPTTKTNWDAFRFHLLHENVRLLLDWEGDWMIEFLTPCTALGSDGRCTIHAARPELCRRYPSPGAYCEYEADVPAHRLRFETPAELERYLDEQGVDWRFRR